MDAIDSVVDPLRDFAKDSVRLVKRCHKPDRKGFFLLLPRNKFFDGFKMALFPLYLILVFQTLIFGIY